MFRFITMILSFAAAFCLTAVTAFAKPDWPTDTGVQSESGIVMDMDSGAVLFAQGIHQEQIPASITKLLTALVVIENTEDLEEPVTFSYDAVYNVESGAGNKFNLEEGDVLTVRECLYAMLLQSSNQSANALAEHVGGSRAGFADMMNQRIAELGCTESHFANPSGLNDDTQRVTAYDMALISRACFQNETLLEIASTKSYKLPPTKNNPNGRTCSIEHKMLLEDDPNYDPDAIAGKTGWTSQAGQTLVTYAARDGRRQVAVTLKSTQKTHYSDTRTILDFGFVRFKNINVADSEIDYVTGENPVEINGVSYQPSELSIDPAAVITLPGDAQFTDAEKKLVTEMPKDHPKGAVALLSYTYNERKIGDAWLFGPVTEEEDSQASADPMTSQTATSSQPDSPSGGKPSGGKIGLPLLLLFGGILLLFAAGGSTAVFVIRRRRKAEAERKRIWQEKRRQRLAEIGCSQEEFNHLLEERRRRRDEDL